MFANSVCSADAREQGSCHAAIRATHAQRTRSPSEIKREARRTVSLPQLRGAHLIVTHRACSRRHAPSLRGQLLAARSAAQLDVAKLRGPAAKEGVVDNDTHQSGWHSSASDAANAARVGHRTAGGCVRRTGAGTPSRPRRGVALTQTGRRARGAWTGCAARPPPPLQAERGPLQRPSAAADRARRGSRSLRRRARHPPQLTARPLSPHLCRYASRLTARRLTNSAHELTAAWWGSHARRWRGPTSSLPSATGG